MTIEGTIARDIAIQMEMKKDKLSQNQDGAWKITFNVHPNDMHQDILTHHMGQRYQAFFVPVGDDERPVEKPKSYAGQAKMMAKEDAFQSYVANAKGKSSCYGEGEAEQWIEFTCGVDSCSDIIDGSSAGYGFKRLQAAYLRWRDRPPLEAYND